MTKFNEGEVRREANKAVNFAYKELGDDATESAIIDLATKYMNSLSPQPYCVIIEEEK